MASQLPVVEWLRRGGPWGQAPEIVETHAAMVFLAGDRAYKLKKEVNLGYLDFSTSERRRAALGRELTLNRRTAPSMYLRIVPITRNRSSEFALEGDGEVDDWLLEMRRFPNEALMSRLADRGALDDALVERLAAHIARFHDREQVVGGYDWPVAVRRIAKENDDDLRLQATTFPAEDVAAVGAARDSVARAVAPALGRQSSDVRHCHGDLHLGNAFLDHGQPTLFDCIEFDEFYATMPPLYDLAFLLMDLLARGQTRLANRALNAWFIHRDRAHWRDTVEGMAALPLYLALRAEIRAKTEGRRPGGGDAARAYLGLARKVMEPRQARLIAVGGLSGTGKSSLAKDLAWCVGAGAGAIHLRSDEIRKRIAHVALTERLPLSAYTQQESDRVYADLYDLAEVALKSGQAVILDAVFARERERDRVAAIATRTGLAFDGLWLEAPTRVLERRVAGRKDDASDADVAVLRKQLTYDLGSLDWQRVDASPSAVEIAQKVKASLGLQADCSAK